MKRALAIAVAVCTVGFAGFSQLGPITGTWKGEICWPDFTFGSTLTLNYQVAGITITSISTFDETGFAGQVFKMNGAFGPFSLTGSMTFDPVGVAYVKGDLSTGFDFAGVGLTLKVEHWGPGNEGIGSVCPQTNDQGNLKYTLTAKLAPITAQIVFVDCCTGTFFSSLVVTMKGLGLCCGITYDVGFSFTKAGFDYVLFTVKDFAAICCGISFDLSVKFTTTAKTVTVTPKFAGFGEACFEVYGDLDYEGGVGNDLYLAGLRIDGFKIRCEIADCNYIEFVTFLSPEYAADYGYDMFDLPCGEFEYIGFGACGAGCCGGKYTVDMKIFFGTAGGLFDVTRMGGEMVLPIMGNLSLTVAGYVAAADCAESSVCVGWVFTF